MDLDGGSKRMPPEQEDLTQAGRKTRKVTFKRGREGEREEGRDRIHNGAYKHTCWLLSLPVTIWTKSASLTRRVTSTVVSLSPSRREGVTP